MYQQFQRKIDFDVDYDLKSEEGDMIITKLTKTPVESEVLNFKWNTREHKRINFFCIL